MKVEKLVITQHSEEEGNVLAIEKWVGMRESQRSDVTLPTTCYHTELPVALASASLNVKKNKSSLNVIFNLAVYHFSDATVSPGPK